MDHPADAIFERLRLWAKHRAKAEIALGAPDFKGKPHSWFEDKHWGCGNGHIAGTNLKSDEHGKQCLRCGASVVLIEPMSEKEFGKVIFKILAATS